MTRDQLQKGKELSSRLEWLENERSKWESASQIIMMHVKSNITYNQHYEVDCSLIDFEELKWRAIIKIQEEITNIQKELNSL